MSNRASTITKAIVGATSKRPAKKSQPDVTTAKAKRNVDEQLKRDITGNELSTFLANCRLPQKYPKLSADDQQRVRISVLTSWFDLSRPDFLCTDVERFLSAMYMWVEMYFKPARCNATRYYYQDPTCKYDMIRGVMSPAKTPTEPTKSIVCATRRLSKTESIVLQMCSLIAITRPGTEILISEFNATRNKEEIGKIQQQVEENECIRNDFGGEGRLFPKRGRVPWNSEVLTFLHDGIYTRLRGHSINSAQRGRGPDLGIWDDPEPDEETYNREWRRWLFDQLFNTYLPMFHPGGHFCWIGTPIHESSCLSLAMGGVQDGIEDDTRERDSRFDDFYKLMFPMIARGEDGEWFSRQPERLSVEGFHTKVQTQGWASVAAEILCKPETPGARCFPYNGKDHGFARVSLSDGSGDFVVDFLHGTIRPWDEFFEELRVFGAVDLSTGESLDCDPGAVVFVGVDPHGIVWVLDTYIAKVTPDKMIDMVFTLAEMWHAEVVGWERVSFQTVVIRQAQRRADELRAEGKAPPVCREVQNAVRDKIRRIMTMIPLFHKKEIRFRVDRPITIAETGVEYVPRKTGREAHYTELMTQVMDFTDIGLRRHDDGIDALEMAIRVAGRARGERLKTVDEHPLETSERKWAKLGLTIGRHNVDPEHWTDKMHREALALPQTGLVAVTPYL